MGRLFLARRLKKNKKKTGRQFAFNGKKHFFRQKAMAGLPPPAGGGILDNFSFYFCSLFLILVGEGYNHYLD
jgi:hypothetical protein